MDSLEKNMIGKFSIREILEAFLEAGRWSSFPGSSRAIREESHVWPIKAKLYVEHCLEEGMKICIKGQGHMTKMAAMAINSKNL